MTDRGRVKACSGLITKTAAQPVWPQPARPAAPRRRWHDGQMWPQTPHSEGHADAESGRDPQHPPARTARS